MDATSALRARRGTAKMAEVPKASIRAPTASVSPPHATDPHSRCRPYPSRVLCESCATIASTMGVPALATAQDVRRNRMLMKVSSAAYRLRASRSTRDSTMLMTAVACILVVRKFGLKRAGISISAIAAHIGCAPVFARRPTDLRTPACVGERPTDNSQICENLFHATVPAELAKANNLATLRRSFSSSSPKSLSSTSKSTW
mmetsp:Transcript_15575/g.42272  ORF Transcript_15575/g.42272 Transcript_15575/m.42272 type:complete len:202 (+) Transcript_15575:56-661(+)